MMNQSSETSPDHKAQFVKSLLNDMKADGVETSFELEAFLQTQYAKRDNLQQKKRDVETRIEELAVRRQQEVQGQLDKLQATFSSLKIQLAKLKKEKLPSKFEQPQFYENVDTIDTLSRGDAYLTVLNFVKSTSDQIEANLENELETEAIELFHRLKSIKQLYIDETGCNYLKEYCSKITAYWEARLQEKVVRDFEKLLEAFGWPMSIKTANPTLETHEKFHKTIRNLFRISSSVKLKDKTSPLVESAVFNDDEPLLPIGVMMKPLKKRFKFHFFNNKVTGDPSKPEWYFCQIKKWMRELTPFVRSHLEAFSVAETKVSSAVEFVRSLSEMLLVKVDSQLSSEDGVDDDTFAKILEESIIFESEVRGFIRDDMLKCPTYIPKFVSTIYSQPVLLQRWLSIEKRACLEKLDEMFASPTAWNRASVPGPSEITDLFIAVLRFVVERFSYLEQPGHKLQFILLIVELLDDFRVRCLQTWQSKCEYPFDKPCSVLFDYIIADSVNRVKETLQTWQDLPFFSSLCYFLEQLQQEEKKLNEALKSELDTQSNYMIELNKRASADSKGGDFDLIGDVSDGLFSSSIKLYKCLIDEIQSKWLQRVMEMIDEPLREYAKVKWQAYEIESIHSKNTPEFDMSINKVTEIVSSLKCAVMEGMDEKMGLFWIKKVAGELDKHLLRMVILPNRFSKDGVQKLYVDLVDGIVKFFRLLHVSPQIFFLAVLSTIRILTMSKGDAMLLYETLNDGDSISQESALMELRIELRREIVIQILKSRTDFYL